MKFRSRDNIRNFERNALCTGIRILPWRWRQYASLKLWYSPTSLQRALTQMNPVYTMTPSFNTFSFKVNIITMPLAPCGLPSAGYVNKTVWFRSVLSHYHRLYHSNLSTTYESPHYVIFSNLLLFHLLCSSMSSAVTTQVLWYVWVTAIQAGKSRTRFPIGSLSFFHLFNPSDLAMALGSKISL